MKTRKGQLAALVFGVAVTAMAADIPWTYDTSKRTEPVPSSEQSPALPVLDAKSDDAIVSGSSGVDSHCISIALAVAGIDLDATPLGTSIIIY